MGKWLLSPFDGVPRDRSLRETRWDFPGDVNVRPGGGADLKVVNSPLVGLGRWPTALGSPRTLQDGEVAYYRGGSTRSVSFCSRAGGLRPLGLVAPPS